MSLNLDDYEGKTVLILGAGEFFSSSVSYWKHNLRAVLGMSCDGTRTFWQTPQLITILKAQSNEVES